MLMESEHSMAREDRDGCETEIEFMAFVSCFVGEYKVYENPRNRGSRFSLTAGPHEWAEEVMVVAFVRIVHDSGGRDEVQNLGLTPPNHGQTLGDKARAGSNYRVATIRPGVAGRQVCA
jgi:hypothetical protein